MGIVVIGRNGQLARSLAGLAIAQGDPLTVLGRPEIDLLRPDTAEPAITALAPDVVINATAYTAVDRAEDEPEAARAVNAEAPGLIAGICERIGSALIHVSTDYVFDGRKAEPYVEADDTAPASVYGATKLDGERRVAAVCARHLILRTAWLHSPHGANFVTAMLDLARREPTVPVVDDQRGSPTYAPHLAEVVLALARRIIDSGDIEWGLYHAAGTGVATRDELAREIFDRARRLGGPWARVRPIGSAEFPTRARRPANSALDCSALERTFGLRLAPWREGVAICVARFLEATGASGQAQANAST